MVNTSEVDGVVMGIGDGAQQSTEMEIRDNNRAW